MVGTLDERSHALESGQNHCYAAAGPHRVQGQADNEIRKGVLSPSTGTLGLLGIPSNAVTMPSRIAAQDYAWSRFALVGALSCSESGNALIIASALRRVVRKHGERLLQPPATSAPGGATSQQQAVLALLHFLESLECSTATCSLRALTHNCLQIFGVYCDKKGHDIATVRCVAPLQGLLTRDIQQGCV